MTPADSARVIAALHGAFPYVEIDDSVTAVWANALANSDYTCAMRAAGEWVQTSTRWPTIAEFNGIMRRIRESDPNSNVRQMAVREAPADVATARAAFARGLRQARAEAGDLPEEVDAKVDAKLAHFPHSIPGIG